MNRETFNQQIKRHQALKEYNKAFRLCLDNIDDPELVDDAYEGGKNLIKQYGYLVMESKGKRTELTVPLNIDIDWIIDTAISLGYKTLERGTISVGILSSVPGISIGGFLAKQKFGIKKNKNNTTSLLYATGTFSSDYKLINRLCSEILERLHNQKRNEH